MAGKNFKIVDKYWGIWSSVLYGMQEIRWINFNMGCIETRNYSVLSAELLQINFNMGCIETKRTVEACITFQRLTLTWDVLKPRIIFPIYTTIRINFNMGCIET